MRDLIVKNKILRLFILFFILQCHPTISYANHFSWLIDPCKEYISNMSDADFWKSACCVVVGLVAFEKSISVAKATWGFFFRKQTQQPAPPAQPQPQNHTPQAVSQAVSTAVNQEFARFMLELRSEALDYQARDELRDVKKRLTRTESNNVVLCRDFARLSIQCRDLKERMQRRNASDSSTSSLEEDQESQKIIQRRIGLPPLRLERLRELHRKTSASALSQRLIDKDVSSPSQTSSDSDENDESDDSKTIKLSSSSHSSGSSSLRFSRKKGSRRLKGHLKKKNRLCFRPYLHVDLISKSLIDHGSHVRMLGSSQQNIFYLMKNMLFKTNFQHHDLQHQH